MKQEIATTKAPAAIGPYSQAIEAGGFVYVSGQIPVLPETSKLASDTIAGQTKQVLENLKAVLDAAGCGMEQVIKTTCYLADMKQFADMNAVYAQYFHGMCPARATVEVSRLPKDVLIEIDAIAFK